MANNGKVMTAIIEIAGKISPTLGKSVADVGKKLGGMNLKAIAAGAAITGAFVASTKAIFDVGKAAVTSAATLEKQMSNVATLLDGDVTGRIGELQKSVLSVSNSTGIATADLTDGLYQVVSAFGDSADAAKQLEIAAKAAKAGNATTTDSINLLAAVTKGYGDTSAKAQQKAADLAFETVKLGQTSFPELAASMGKVIPLASTLKVTEEDLFGAMSTLTGVTGNTAEVSTQLKATMQGFLQPSADMAKAIKKCGYASGQAMLDSEGLQGALDLLKKQAGGNELAFAQMFSSVEAKTAVLAMTGAQAENLTAKTRAMYEASGAASAAFDAQTDNLQDTIAKLKNMGANFLTSAGTTLLPVVRKVADKVLPIITDTLDKILPAVETCGTAIGDIISEILPVVSPIISELLPPIISLTSKILTKLVPPISKIALSLLPIVLRLVEVLTPVIDFFVTDVLPSLLDIVNAILPVISDIVGKIVPLVVQILSKVFPILSKFISDLLPVILGLIEDLTPVIMEIIDKLLPVVVSVLNELMPVLSQILSDILPFIIELINELIPVVLEIAEAVLPVIIQLLDTLMPIAIQIIRMVLPIVIQLVKALLPIIMKIVNTVLPILVEVLNILAPILDMILSLLGPLLDLFMSILTPILDLISEAIDPLISIFSELINKALKPLRPILTTLANIFKNVLGNAIESLKPIIAAVKKYFGGIIDFVKSVFTGDWSAAWDAVKRIFSGIWDGLKATVQAAINGIRTSFSALGDALTCVFTVAWERIKTVWGGVGKFFTGIWSGIKSAFGAVTDWFKNIFSGAWQAVKNVFSTGGKVFEGIKDGIVDTFKTVVNAIIRGINKVVKVPFDGINWALGKIKGVEIVGLKPFDWIKTINVPQIPELAAGGFTQGVSIAGEAGTEAVISFDPSKRQENLKTWARAGKLLGAFKAFTATATNSISAQAGRLASMDDFSLGQLVSTTNIYYDFSGFTWSPQVSGVDGAKKSHIMDMLRECESEFFDWLEEWLKQRGCGDYAHNSIL